MTYCRAVSCELQPLLASVLYVTSAPKDVVIICDNVYTWIEQTDVHVSAMTRASHFCHDLNWDAPCVLRVSMANIFWISS